MGRGNVLSFFYSGGTLDIKTPLHELPLPKVVAIEYDESYPESATPLNQLCQRIQQELLVEVAFREIGIRPSSETTIAIGGLR